MKWFEKLILRPIFVPTLILFILMPRSFYHMVQGNPLGLLFFILFATISAAYIFGRFMVILRLGADKKKRQRIILDSVLVILGVIVSCCLQSPSISTFMLLTCLTSIPFHITNYMTVMAAAC